MSRFVLRTVLSILCLAGVIVFSFSCVCSPSECEEISEDDCPAGGGTVWDPCKCCRVCARIEGEPCGGPHGFHGTCAKGFDCVISSHATGKPVSTANSEGICTRQAKSQANCETPSRAFGCNIIGNKCWCEKVFFCTEDSPFMFATAEECQVNLEVMLRHELADLQQSGLGSQHFLHPEPHEGNRTGREAGGRKALGGVRTAQEGPQYPPKWRAEFSGRQ